jgi:hypothetical protein
MVLGGVMLLAPMLTKQINSKRSVRFFGGAHAPVPVGLRCWHCGACFAYDSVGLWFEREHACYPSHPMCFANAAVSAYLERFLP